MARTLLATLGVAAVLLAACNDDGDDAALTRAQALEEIEALCAKAGTGVERINAEFEAAGAEPGDIEGAVDRVERLFVVNTRLQRGLDELELPSGAKALGEFVDSHRDQVRRQRAALVKARSGDLDQLEAAAGELEAAEQLPRAPAAAAGLRNCSTTPDTLDRGSEPRISDDGDSMQPGSALLGTWEGEVVQHGPGDESQTYPVVMRIGDEIGSDGSNGHISYPTFSCDGSVRIFEAGDAAGDAGYRYKLREEISVGRKACSNDATISAAVYGDELEWRWQLGDVQVVGVLERRGAPARAQVPKPAAIDGAGLVGRWEGEATQYGPGSARSEYTVETGVYPYSTKPGGNDAWVSYPDSPCTAGTTFIEARGDRASFQEMIYEGDCFDGGRIEFRRVAPSTALWRWYGKSGDGAPVEVFAVLERVSEIPDPPP